MTEEATQFARESRLQVKLPVGRKARETFSLSHRRLVSMTEARRALKRVIVEFASRWDLPWHFRHLLTKLIRLARAQSL